MVERFCNLGLAFRKINTQGLERSSQLECDGNGGQRFDRATARLIKVRPDLCVFLIADPVYLFQVVSASEWPRCDNSRRHHWADTGYCFQLFFRRRVDVELGREQSLGFARR